MATIYRHYGAWRVQIRKQGCAPLSKTFFRKRDADLWAREMERCLELGLFQHPSSTTPTTLGDVLDRYVREVSPHKRGYSSERYRIAKIRRHDLCRIALHKLQSADIAAYRNARSGEVASSTIRKELQIISHALDLAAKEWGEHLPQNPVKDIRKPTEGEGRERRLGPDEQRALLEAAAKSHNQWLEPLIGFALETGMRRGELLALSWPDLSLERRVACLRVTKSGRSRRVPLSPRAVAIMAALPRDPRDRVFPLSKEALRSTWKTACRRAAIEDLRFHDLRHEATTRLFEKGLNVMEVSSITGHRDLRMLQRYTHLKAEDLARKLG